MGNGVLVAGGGIAGFGLGIALGAYELPFTIVERLPGPPPGGLGLNLPANAVRALAELGLGEEVVRAGVPVRRREYRNESDRLLFAVDEAAFWADVGPSVCVRRSVLLDLLQAGVPATNVRWGTSVTGVTPADRLVRVATSSGAVEEHDYVVGADGVHSAVRGSVAGDGDIRPSMMTTASWRFVVPNPGVDCWTVWSGSDGTFLLIPVDAEHAYGYASATKHAGVTDRPEWLAETFESFPTRVRRAVDAALADLEHLYHSPVVEVHAARWSTRRITLVGDAAHAMGPVWAQGAALALEDGLVLARLLAERPDWDVVGEEFETIRRARVEHVRAATDRMSRLAAIPSWLRDLLGPVLGPKAYRSAYEPLREPVLASRPVS